MSKIKVDCLSDLHGFYPNLEGGDLLIIAGDLTARHTEKEWHEFATWMNDQNYRKIVFIAGNHDTMIEKWDKEQAKEGYKGPVSDPSDRIEYLCDSGTEFEGLKIWGAPWSLWFNGVNPRCKAFMGSESDLAKKWEKIPRNTDILITHTPPFNVLDTIVGGKMVGSTSLLEWIAEWKPRLHVFGHVHEAYGKKLSFFGKRHFGNQYGVTMINASHVDEKYRPVNKPVRVEL